MKIYRIASSHSIVYHNTSPENVFLVERNGLKINQEWGKSMGAKETIEQIYGMRPVFVGLTPDKFKGARDVTLKIDVTGLDMVADIPSLYDKRAYYDMEQDLMWFEEANVPLQLLDYVDENGAIYFSDLLNPNNPLVDICINLTQTAAIEQSIEPSRIQVLG